MSYKIDENDSQREVVKAYLDKALAASHTPPADTETLIARITEGLKRNNAVLVAHYYCSPELQALAEQTGGCVADSLEMARFGQSHSAQTLIVAGVRFMGETAKILSPEKRVFMPTLEATCSLDIGCPVDEFSAFCDANPDRTVVVYANTSAAVKACSDWVVTSSIALDVVDYLDRKGEKILWAPDKYLGSYVAEKTGADVLLWSGSCIVHEEFKARGILDLKKQFPDAAVLVHPESPKPVVDLADAVGSTSQLINAARDLPNSTFIVATDQGIFYKMQQACPDKQLVIAPTAGNGATCRSCANCPWMAMNELQNLDVLLSDLNCAHALNACEVHVDEVVARKAMVPLQRMLDFNNPSSK